MIDLKPSTASAVKKRFFPMEDNNFTKLKCQQLPTNKSGNEQDLFYVSSTSHTVLTEK